jgi:hypothetical protein
MIATYIGLTAAFLVAGFYMAILYCGPKMPAKPLAIFLLGGLYLSFAVSIINLIVVILGRV